jgi:hypothetical protein
MLFSVFVDRLGAADRQTSESGNFALIKEFLQGFRQLGLIIFDRQEIAAAALQYLLCDLRLTADHIDRGDTALERQRLQQRLDRPDLPAFPAGTFPGQAVA